DNDDEEESSEDDEMDIEADEEEEEEEHPAPADFVVVAPTGTDQAPSVEETEPFETDESAAMAIRISQKFVLLEEERPVIETMAYHDKYKKILNEVGKDKVEIDGKIVKEEEDAVKRIKREALKEKDNTGAFIFPIRLEGKVNENALVDTGREAKSRYNTKLAQLLPRHIYSPCVMNWDVLNKMGCDGEIDDMLRIRLREAGSNEEIFISVAWIRAFNINEPIYAELCHKFYYTYKFDEVCVDDELQSKKIIKFRLGGRAYNLTLLEFARRLGLYQAVELEEEGFNVYFEREDNLGLSRIHTSTIKNLLLRVIYKMMTYGLCQRTTGYEKIQKNDLWLLSMFDARHQNGYHGVFEHMDGVYSVPLQGAYNTPGYAQPQYNQYYQQYQPPPP
nr:hypothetical protein [Tanacetum cinerariifolium]